MLIPAQVKPLLLHPDREIRSAAVEYFQEACSTDPDIIPLVLQAWSQFEEEEAYSQCFALASFTFDSANFLTALQRLSTTKNPHMAELISMAIAHAPLPLFDLHKNAILNTKNIDPNTALRVVARQEAAEMSDQALWKELHDFSTRHQDKEFIDDPDNQHIGDIIEALAARRSPDSATICKHLGEEYVRGKWLESFLVALSGERRLTAAVPVLLAKLSRESNAHHLPVLIAAALAHIGDPKTIDLIRARYLENTDDVGFRREAPGIVAVFKVPAAEETLLAFLETEKDPLFREYIFHALARLFSEKAIDLLRAELKASDDPDLRSDLLLLAAVHNRTFPGLEEYKEEERLELERRSTGGEDAFEEENPAV